MRQVNTSSSGIVVSCMMILCLILLISLGSLWAAPGVAYAADEDYGTADREFNAAVSVANRTDAWGDLGTYCMLRGQDHPAVAVLKEGLVSYQDQGPSIVGAAMLLDDMHREPRLAEAVFREYLGGNGKSDAAPVVRVDMKLGKLPGSEGDKSGAKIEFSNALKLASGYPPAEQALQ